MGLQAIEPLHNEHIAVGPDFGSLFVGELNPVAPKAQRKVPIPQGFTHPSLAVEWRRGWGLIWRLDLDAWINDPLPESSSEEEEEEEPVESPPTNAAFQRSFGQPPSAAFYQEDKKPERVEPTSEDLQRVTFQASLT